MCDRKLKSKQCRPETKCIKCGRKSVSGHKENGHPICHNCYLKTYVTPLGKCSVCGITTNVFTRRPKILCKKCFMISYRPPLHICSVCGNKAPSHKNMEDGYICKKCYKKTYKPPKRICIECGKSKNCNSNGKCLSCHNKWRMQNDEQFCIRTRIRKRISKILNRVGASNKYPINYNKIADFLGPCPGERDEYHIDHIFPLSAFDLTNKNQLLAAVAPENHQWLLISDNCRKKDIFDQHLFKKYLKKYCK